MTRRRRVAVAVLGALLLAVGTLAALVALASRHSDRLVAAVSKNLGRTVDAGRVALTVVGGIGVTIADVRIADDPALDAQEPFLAARRFEMRLRVLPLLRRRLVVDRIVIDEPVVNLVREPSGRMNVDSLRKPPKSPAPAGGAPQGGRPAFQLADLRLRHGTIRYRERASGRAVELAEVAVDARQPRFDAPVPISVRARLATQDLTLENIQSQGTLDLAAERPTYTGSVEAGPGMLGKIAVDRLTATIRATPPTIDLDSATAATLGGTVSGTAHVTAAGEEAGLTATLDAKGLDLAKLPAPQDRPHPAGTLALHGTLAGPPGGAAFASGATGDGRFEVGDGRIVGAGLGRPVLDVVQPFLRPGVADRLRTRYPDLFEGDDLRFTRLSGSGRLRGGRIRSDDFVLAAPSYEARGEGSLGVDGDVDATVRLAASPALTDDVLGQSRARPMLVDARGQLVIPLHASGPLRHPRVTPDPAFAATVARGLLGETGLGQAAGDLLERLLAPRHKR